MNKKLIFSVLLVVCLLAVVSVVAFAQTRPVERWEYNVVNYRQLATSGKYVDMTPALNRLGAEGWELVGAPGDGADFIFKRKLP